jgi:hypothetical protein
MSLQMVEGEWRGWQSRGFLIRPFACLFLSLNKPNKGDCRVDLAGSSRLATCLIL